MITAEIVADSLNPVGSRLTTFVVCLPRIVLAELNTHRAFSRNSASSRAIPFEKMLERVKNDPFIPIKFQKDHKGMQGIEYFEGEEHEQCIKDWLAARDLAVKAATSFKLNITKQLRNRLLEPFLWHTVILTSSDFENFFALRAHKDAEIHIQALAYKMLEVYNNSTPKQLQKDEWHIPFGDKIELHRLSLELGETLNYQPSQKELEFGSMKIAVARCARISYNTFEGKDDYSADIKLCEKLFGGSPKHLSPTEHVAQAQDNNDPIGNFRGFKQYRYMFNDQNLRDGRVIKK
jgi:thymidylate synthase ThyX